MVKQEKFPHTLVQFNNKKKKLDVLLTDEGLYKWFDTEVAAIEYMQQLSMKNPDAVKNVYSLSAASYANMKFNFNFMVKYPSSVKNTEDVVFSDMHKVSFELNAMGILGCLPPMSFLLAMLAKCDGSDVNGMVKQLSTCEPVICRSCSTVCLSPPIAEMSLSETKCFNSTGINNFYCTYCGAARIIGIMEYQSSIHKLDFNSDIIKIKNTVASGEVLKVNSLIADFGNKYALSSFSAKTAVKKAATPSSKITDKQPWLN